MNETYVVGAHAPFKFVNNLFAQHRNISFALCGMLLYLLGALQVHATSAAPVGTDFYYTFNSPGVLYEAGSMNTSSSPYFYVNSGGKMILEDGRGKTIQGDLPKQDPVRVLYNRSNALDTDNGAHPQNTFRLLTRSTWQDVVQQVSFRITKQNISDSPNRDGHNGVLLMSRYTDQYNLYYAGIRNDGQAIIKKKIDGTYYTLASVQIFGVSGVYDRTSEPYLLPRNTWMRLKTQVINQRDGSVRIRLLIDRENDGSFVSILSTDDHGVGGDPFRAEGYAGIRTDFMDVEFDNYRLTDF